MARIDALRTDPAKETEGVWFDHPLGFRFKLARVSTPAWESHVYEELIEVSREKGMLDDSGRPSKRVTPDVHREAVLRTLSKKIVKDWTDIEDKDGKPVACSSDQALAYLRDPELHELPTWIAQQASERERYRKDVARAEVSN